MSTTKRWSRLKAAWLSRKLRAMYMGDRQFWELGWNKLICFTLRCIYAPCEQLSFPLYPIPDNLASLRHIVWHISSSALPLHCWNGQGLGVLCGSFACHSIYINLVDVPVAAEGGTLAGACPGNLISQPGKERERDRESMGNENVFPLFDSLSINQSIDGRGRRISACLWAVTY